MQLNRADSKIGPSKVDGQIKSLKVASVSFSTVPREDFINLLGSAWHVRDVRRDLTQGRAALLQALVYRRKTSQHVCHPESGSTNPFA